MPASGWREAQDWERDWWSTCCNTWNEESKQLLYADRMGLRRWRNEKGWPQFDLGGRSVLDLGGGPCSLLLKCVNLRQAEVVDPLPFPDWVRLRYQAAGIRFVNRAAEEYELPAERFEECWLYNVLQHTYDPAKIVANARKAAEFVRIFEWLDTPPNIGHPQTLTEAELNEWLGGEGRVETLTGQSGCRGKCYYGVFPT